MVIVAGEITTSAWIDIPQVVRNTVREIGYTSSNIGFDSDTCAVITAIEKQSPDISQGVTEGAGLHKEQGAGDQGLMFGYATDETTNFMPAPIDYAHQLARQLALVRKTGQVNFLRPDGKTQVTLEYENDKPVRCDAIVVSTQHDESVKYKSLREAVIDLVVDKVMPKNMFDKNTKIHVNPTGRFVIGGPQGDCGLTGRKIIVDTYGGMGRHGGGAFSGKDPSKVDRSACYYARFIAKNVVAAKLAARCEVQIAYAIGVAKPVGVHVNTFGTGRVADERLETYILEHFDMRPKALIEELNLLSPIYKSTAAYGHFGRPGFSWESTSRAAQIAADLLPSKAKGRAVKSTNGHANGTHATNGTNGKHHVSTPSIERVAKMDKAEKTKPGKAEKKQAKKKGKKGKEKSATL
jgi:S-adenosylmethionine synthetase